MNNYNSQFGEDKFLVEELGMPETGFFLDFGAGDPVRLSNTYYFEQKGWDGICIDGDYRNFERLHELRKRVVLGVINDRSGLVGFNISGHGADLSSVKYGDDARKIITSCFSVEDLFAELYIPAKVDLVSLDIEGHELLVLESLFKHREPDVFIVEYNDDEGGTSEVSRFFEDKPYKLVLKNQANLIYKHE